MNESWQIGDIRVTRVVEMEVTGGTRFILPDATRDACLEYEWMRPHFMDEKGNLIMSIHAFVVDTGSHRIVVDTCIGNDKQRSIPTWSNLQTSFLNDLTELGYAPATIDMVMCTHLHVDHVGWNTRLVDGRWVATFPQARYLIAESEWDYWRQASDSGDTKAVLADSVLPIVDAGLARFVPTDFELTPGVRLKSTPGHTPGHVSVSIESNGTRALITGDCIHHPVQMTRLDWCSSADSDQAQALQTRTALLDELVDEDVLVLGTHFATPTAGRVKQRPAGGYWFDVQ